MTTLEKSKLILLDADVIICLHESGLWDAFSKQYEISLSRIVCQECAFFERSGSHEGKVYIDWEKYCSQGDVKIFDLDAEEMMRRYSLKGKNPEDLGLHIGEAETIALLLDDSMQETRICLADRAAIRGAVFMDLKERCISLESALNSIGISRQLQKQFREDWMRQSINTAEIEKIQIIKN